jgi:hypothetical protein
MTPLATSADVVTRLGRALTATETVKVTGLLEEASVKVLAHLGKGESYYDALTIPATVSIVTSRMVARVLEQAPAGMVPGTQQTGVTTGPFSNQTTFVAGSSNGSPWLSRSDRADLNNVLGANKVFAIDTVASSYYDIATNTSYVTPATFIDGVTP